MGAAARSLGVDPSTVQRRLRAIETALGFAIVERRDASYRLTAQGQALLAPIEKVEIAVADLKRAVALLDAGGAGPIRVTSLVTVGQRIIQSGFVDAFQSRHPGMRVEMLLEQRLFDLARDEADIAIRGGSHGHGDLVGRKIVDLPWRIYASRDFIRRHGKPASARDIARFPLIELIDELEGTPAARWMRAQAPRARIAARCANVPSVHLAVKSGAGLAPLPAVHAATDSDLVDVLGAIPELNYPIFLVTHRQLRGQPRVRAFFDFGARNLKPVLLGRPVAAMR
jgi:DNA-binding transcriptional LysR family regulator